VDAPGKHARDHAHNARKLEILSDPAARIAESLRLRKSVQEYEAKHAAGHLKPQEAKPEHARLETRDNPTSKLAKKWHPPENQREERRPPERSWSPRAERVRANSDIGLLVVAVAVAIGYAPAKWEAVAVCAANAVVSHVALANKRWKEKHGDRPEE
jgi:hypothetical protein